MKMLAIGAVVAAGAVLGAAAPARAADNPMQVCGARYQAAKKAGTLPAGQTWTAYLTACRASLAPASAPAPAGQAPAASRMSAPGKMMPLPQPTASKPAGQPSAAQVAARGRQKQCAASYQADKAAGKLAGQTWPKYYSACAKRLKG